MYPTLMEDSNGNQVIITYNAGLGVGWNNSSSRINTIEDVRGNGSSDYTFTYNTDSIPHLTGITNSIGTPENYSFSYASSGLISPFDHTTSFGTFTFLQTATSTGVPLTNTFAYDSSGSGELNQVTTPYGGHLRWTFTPYTLSNSRTWREVQYRYLSQSSGAAETTVQLSRVNDTSYTVHSSATLDDLSANAEKFWSFQTNTSQFDVGAHAQLRGTPTAQPHGAEPSGLRLGSTVRRRLSIWPIHLKRHNHARPRTELPGPKENRSNAGWVGVRKPDPNSDVQLRQPLDSGANVHEYLADVIHLR